MAYTLNYSDPGKITAVTVPDMPPGVNTVDTSLTLVGKGYPNFGQAIDQNFLSLLENFSSPIPPSNPIEGQLWYDTSNPANKVLRVMDGTHGATNWASANGIYQQPTDPSLTTALKSGDIWVNTVLSQLNIYSAGTWIPVGNANMGELNGPFVETITDTTGTNHQITSTYVGGNRISVLAGESFIPNPILSGFTAIYPGVNVASGAFFNGISVTAANLIVNNALFSAGSFLRKNDTSVNGQIITGRMLFSTPNANNQSGSQGRDGVVVNIVGSSNNNYIQFYKLINDAIILNNTAGGNIVLKTSNATSSLPNSTVVVADGVVTINTTTSVDNPSLVVNGPASISLGLSVGGTTSMASNASVSGTLNVGGVSVFGDDITVNGQMYVNWLDGNGNPKSGAGILPSVTNIYDIGSSTAKFNRIYANSIGTTSTQVFGIFNGPATGLAFGSNFVLKGQVTSTNFIFYGNGSTATFNTTLSANAITDQVTATYTTATLTLLVVDTSTSATYKGPQKISLNQLTDGFYNAGMIIMNGSNIPPAGWLLCDGSSYPIAAFPNLAKALQYEGFGSFIYGGVIPNFNVPDLSRATPLYKAASTEPLQYANYIIKY
jgi:hypothetical protein